MSKASKQRPGFEENRVSITDLVSNNTSPKKMAKNGSDKTNSMLSVDSREAAKKQEQDSKKGKRQVTEEEAY